MMEPLPNFFSMFASAASTALPRSTLIRSSDMTYILFLRSFSHGGELLPGLIQREHNTLSARMEQCFIVATTIFFQRVRIQSARPGSPLCAIRCEVRASLH